MLSTRAPLPLPYHFLPSPSAQAGNTLYVSGQIGLKAETMKFAGKGGLYTRYVLYNRLSTHTRIGLDTYSYTQLCVPAPILSRVRFHHCIKYKKHETS